MCPKFDNSIKDQLPGFQTGRVLFCFHVFLNKIAGKRPVWGSSTYLTQHTTPRQATHKKSKARGANLGPANPWVRPSPRRAHLGPAFSWTPVCIFTSVSPMYQKRKILHK